LPYQVDEKRIKTTIPLLQSLVAVQAFRDPGLPTDCPPMLALSEADFLGSKLMSLSGFSTLKAVCLVFRSYLSERELMNGLFAFRRRCPVN